MDSSNIDQILEALTFPALFIDAEERLTRLNGGAQSLIGGGRLGLHYITALRQPALLDAIEAVLRDSQTRNARYLGHDGARSTTWNVNVTRAGTGVLLTFEDQTALEEAGQMRRDFVANVSHELRTPLTALMGFIETLKGPARDDPEAQARFLDIMQSEAGRMSRLVEDLLSLSRVEEEERVRPTQDVALNALVEGRVRSLAPVAEKAGLAVRTDLPAAEVIVPGDERQLRQVVTNLLENALKYGGGGDSVIVSVRGPAPEMALRGDGVRLCVRDFGEGIAAHHLARLTERFYRVDSHRSREIGGTGLGLAIVKHIVNRHRGRLRIESTPGDGSSFTIILPVE